MHFHRCCIFLCDEPLVDGGIIQPTKSECLERDGSIKHHWKHHFVHHSVVLCIQLCSASGYNAKPWVQNAFLNLTNNLSFFFWFCYTTVLHQSSSFKSSAMANAIPDDCLIWFDLIWFDCVRPLKRIDGKEDSKQFESSSCLPLSLCSLQPPTMIHH